MLYLEDASTKYKILAHPCQDVTMRWLTIIIVVCGLDSSLFAHGTLAQPISSSAEEILGSLEEVQMQLSYEALQIYIGPVQILQYTLRLVTNVHWHCICIVAQQI